MAKKVQCRTCGEMVKEVEKYSHWEKMHAQADFDKWMKAVPNG